MISFKNFFNNLLFEGSVKSYKNFIHLADLPMFSIFFDKSILENQELMQFTVIKRMKTSEGVEQFLEHFGDHLKSILREAQSSLGKIGFTRMHSNLVFVDASKNVNQNTGVSGDVAGYARTDKHYMAIDMRHFIHNYRTNPDVISNTIVHEWAHLWFFQNSKAFKKSVEDLYSNLVLSKENLIKSPEISKEYDNKFSIKIIDFWKSYVVRIGELINTTLLKKIDIDEKTVNLIPHSLTFRGKLKNDLNYDLKEGQSVYCEKGNTGWLVGYFDSNTGRRYEIVIPLNDLNKLDNIIQTSYKSIKDAIKQVINGYNNPSEEDIDKNIKDSIISFFQTIKTYEYIKVPDDVIQDVVSEYGSYIKKSVIDIINNFSPNNILDFLNNKDKSYEILWVYNKFKPKDISISSLIKPYALKQLITQKYNNLAGKSLSDPKYADLRTYISKTINWRGKGSSHKSAYGMSNVDEFWATAIDGFFGLTNKHKALFIDLVKNRISNDTETKIKKRKEPIKARQRRSQKLEDIKTVFNIVKSNDKRFSKEKILQDNEIDENIITELINLTLSIIKITKITQEVKQLLYKLVLDMFKDYNYEPEPIEYVIIKRIINTRTR